MEIQVTQIIFQIINFLAILIIFKKFLYKPILKVLDNRSKRIQEGIESAEKNIKLQQELETQREKLLQEAKNQSEQILADAKSQADTIIKEAHRKAKQEAKKIISTQQNALEALAQQQTRDFQSKLASSIITATETVLKGYLDDQKHKDILQKQIHSLKLN